MGESFVKFFLLKTDRFLSDLEQNITDTTVCSTEEKIS